MAKVTAKLTAEQARDKFPDVVGAGYIQGAECFGDHVAILDMGRGAKAVMVNGKWEACCPSRKYAMLQVEKYLTVVALHLSSSTRC